jgi:hypothetical protein
MLRLRSLLRSTSGSSSSIRSIRNGSLNGSYSSRPSSRSFSITVTGDAQLLVRRRTTRPWIYPTSLLLIGIAGFTSFHLSDDVKHTVFAVVRLPNVLHDTYSEYTSCEQIRSSRVARAAILGILDYKVTLSRHYPSEDEYTQALSECHTRSAVRVRHALLLNGGTRMKLLMAGRSWCTQIYLF